MTTALSLLLRAVFEWVSETFFNMLFITKTPSPEKPAKGSLTT